MLCFKITLLSEVNSIEKPESGYFAFQLRPIHATECKSHTIKESAHSYLDDSYWMSEYLT